MKEFAAVIRRMDQARRERRRRALAREVYAEVEARHRAVTPMLFTFAGEYRVIPIADAKNATQAIRDHAVFTLDSALDLRWGIRLISNTDVFAYVDDWSDLGAVSSSTEAFGRLHVVRTGDGLPLHEELPGGSRVVPFERLVAELIGWVGPRWDLLAVLESLYAGPLPLPLPSI